MRLLPGFCSLFFFFKKENLLLVISLTVNVLTHECSRIGDSDPKKGVPVRLAGKDQTGAC